MTDILDVPAVEGAIRNPANPHHFMVLVPISQTIEVWFKGELVARSDAALQVVEIGKSAYAPRVYVPRTDFSVPFEDNDKRTICPLKGEARYLNLNGDELGWTYDTFDFAADLTGYISPWLEDAEIRFLPESAAL